MCWLLTVKHSPFSYQEYPESSTFPTVSKELLILFGICPVNQFVCSNCDVLFSVSLSALSVMFSVLAFSSYPPFDSAPFVSTPNPPFSAHSLFLTFLSEIAPLPTSIFFLSSPSGLFRLVSQHSFSWFHPNAQPLGCGAPPLLLFQLICYPLASFSHPWPPSLFL